MTRTATGPTAGRKVARNPRNVDGCFTRNQGGQIADQIKPGPRPDYAQRQKGKKTLKTGRSHQPVQPTPMDPGGFEIASQSKSARCRAPTCADSKNRHHG